MTYLDFGLAVLGAAAGVGLWYATELTRSIRVLQRTAEDVERQVQQVQAAVREVQTAVRAVAQIVAAPLVHELVDVDVVVENTTAVLMTVQLAAVPRAGERVILPTGGIVEVLKPAWPVGRRPTLLVRHASA